MRFMRFFKRFHLSSGLYQTLMYGLGAGMIRAVSLITLPITTYYLIPAQYGTLQVIQIFGDFGGLFFSIGMVNTLFRFAGKTKSREEQKTIFANSLTILVIVSLFFGLMLFALAPTIVKLLPGHIKLLYIQSAIASLMLEGILSLQLAWLRLRDKATTYLLVNSVEAGCRVFLIIYLLSSGYGILGILITTPLTSLLIIITLMIIEKNEVSIQFNWEMMKKLTIYGAPLMLGGLARFTSYGLDQWWLAKILGVVNLAHYALATKFTMMMGFLMSPYMLWLSPKRFSLLDEENGNEVNARLAGLGITLALILSIAISLGGGLAIKLLTPVSYHAAAALISWLTMAYFFRFSANLLNLGCYIKKTTWTANCIDVISAFIAIASYYTLIPKYGIYGIIVSHYIISLVNLLMFFVVSQKNLYLPYPGKKLIIITVLTVCSLILGNYWDDLVWRFCSTVVLIGIITVISVKFSLIPRPRELISYNSKDKKY